MCTKVEVVTSFGRQGYDLYGKTFVATFAQYLPSDVKITVYAEWDSPQPYDGNIEFRNLLCVPGVEKFLKSTNNPVDHGQTPAPGAAWKQKCLDEGYNFRFDAHKFGRKPFAIFDAMERTAADKVFWVDGDVVALRSIPSSVFDDTLPAGYDVSHLARRGYHSECGWIGVANTARGRGFVATLMHMYATGEFRGLAETHDSFVFDAVAKILTSGDLLPKPKIFNIPHTSQSQPFDNSVLGEYMCHLKGARKRKAESLVKSYKDGVHRGAAKISRKS